MTLNIFNMPKLIWPHISSHFRWKLPLLLILILVVSFAEILSLGALLPFLSVLVAPKDIDKFPLGGYLATFFGVSSANNLLAIFTIIFLCTIVLATLLRLFMLIFSVRLSFEIGVDITGKVYRKILHQSYANYLKVNSSDIINTVSNKSHSIIHSAIMPLMTLISSGVLFCCILGAVYAVDPFVATMTAMGFIFSYLLVMFFTRTRLSREGSLVPKLSTRLIKLLQESLGGKRDILLDGSQSVYCEIYRDADIQLRSAQGTNMILGQFPRSIIESTALLLLAFLAYELARKPGGIAAALPMLGILAMSAQRMLPVMQQAYAAWSSIKNGQHAVQDILDILNEELSESSTQPKPSPMLLISTIEFNNLGFRYAPDLPWIFHGIDLRVQKGERLGIMGASGIGKSTLLDVVMGLLEPTVGSVDIDNLPITESNRRSWQANLAHVPQSVFIADISVEENIAFGVQKHLIDSERVKTCARKAQIDGTIEGLPDQYQTSLGDRGFRLSGGQRQRIGIARALYKQADVIIFDEATSALDHETEGDVMKAIESLSKNLTIFIVAHRLSTLRMCSRVVELQNGGVLREVEPHLVFLDK